MLEHKRSCWFCEWAERYPGYPGSMYEPPEPPMAECSNPQLDAEFFDSLETTSGAWEVAAAEKCGHFEPTMIDKCGYCGEVMLVEEWSWEIWAMSYDNVPCCSLSCKYALEDRFKKEVIEW